MKIFEAAKNLPAELRTTLDDITHALDKRANAERAAIANLNAIAAGERRITDLEASSKELDALAVKAEVMVATDSSLKTEATRAVKAADKAAAELADERRANERRVAAAAIIDAEARGIDESIPDLRTRLTGAVSAYKKQMLAAANKDLEEVCAPLIPIIQAIAAVNAMIPNGGLARDWLDCTKLISPDGYRSDHLSEHVRVHGIDLLATDDPLPAVPAGAATAIQELIAVSKALAQHRKYQPPKVLTAAEQAKQAEREEWARAEAEEQRKWDEEQARRRAMFEAGTLPRSPNVNHDTRLRLPGTPAPRSERNVNAAADVDGSISDEWRRIDPEYDGDRPRQGGR